MPLNSYYTQQQQQPQVNLSDAWKYGGAQDFTTTPDNAFLSRIQQYDPNAQYIRADNGENPNNPMYQLQYDITKLPKNPTGNNGLFGVQQLGGYMRDNGLDSLKTEDQLYNYNAIKKDPTYGYVTPNQNVKNKFDWLDYGPLFVGLAAGGFGALGSLYGLGGAGAGLGSSFMSGMNAMKLPNMLMSTGRALSSGNYGSLLNAGLSYGMGQFMPNLGTFGNMAMRTGGRMLLGSMYNRGRRG